MRRFLWLVPLLAGVAAYAIAPWGELVWDDQGVVNQQMVALRTLADVLVPPDGIPQWSYDYYRPVTVLSYLLDLRLFGLGASVGPHLANVAYHLLTTFFVWLLLGRLLRPLPAGAFAAMAAATLFAVHPIHTESVSWVTGRSDLLATLFLVPALLLALRWHDRGSLWALLLAPVVFLLALLTKEVAIAGLVMLPLLLLIARPPVPGIGPPDTQSAGQSAGQSTGQSAPVAAGGGPVAFLAMAACWLAAAWYYLTLRRAAAIGMGRWDPLSAETFWRPARAAAWYVWKTVVPWPQTNFAVWEMVPGRLATVVILLPVAVLVAWLGWRLRDRQARAGAAGIALAGLLCFAAALVPSLLVPLAGVAETPVAERYLYLPTVGAALALGAALGRVGPAWLDRRSLATGRRTMGRRAWAAAGATGAVAVVWLGLTLARGYVWLGDVRLWTNAISQVSNYGLPYIEYGKALSNAGEEDLAMEAFQRAATLPKSSAKTTAVAHFNMGATYYRRHNLDAAEQAFLAAIKANPVYAQSYYGLGRVLYARGINADADTLGDGERLDKLGQAVTLLAEAIRRAPAFPDAQLALAFALNAHGDALRKLGRLDEARASYTATLARMDEAARLEPATALRQGVPELRKLAGIRLRQLPLPLPP